jgi:hypothetical protein
MKEIKCGQVRRRKAADFNKNGLMNSFFISSGISIKKGQNGSFFLCVNQTKLIALSFLSL